MKKKNPSKEEHSTASDEKTVFRQTGELIGTIGAHIALGTAKVIDFVSDEATVVKKAIKKKLAKKAVQKKKAVKKVLPIAANKPVKKIARKKTTKKGGKKFARNTRKAAKKTASNRVKK
jgi:excinuclease UvrABC helicase subunit UvrB